MDAHCIIFIFFVIALVDIGLLSEVPRSQPGKPHSAELL